MTSGLVLVHDFLIRNAVDGAGSGAQCVAGGLGIARGDGFAHRFNGGAVLGAQTGVD